MTQVAQLTIDMAANVARLRQDMDKAVTTVDGAMGKVRRSADLAMQAIATIGVGVAAAGLANWVKQGIEAADSTSKLAQKTGLLTKEVAGLQLAFQQGGAGDKFQGALAKLSKNAADGVNAFAAMGVQVKTTTGELKPTRDLIGEVAAKFATYQDGAAKTALAQELFGKSGADLIPILNGGADALDEYDQKAAALGLTLRGDTAKSAEKFNDDLDLLQQRTQGIARQLASELLPVLTQISGAFAKSAQNGGDMSKAGEVLVGVIERVTVYGANVGYVFSQIGNEIGGMAAQAAALASLDFSGFSAIGRAMKDDAAAARDEIDKFTDGVLGAREAAKEMRDIAYSDVHIFSRAAELAASAKKAAPLVDDLANATGAKRTADKAAAVAARELAAADREAAAAAKELATTRTKIAELAAREEQSYADAADAIAQSNQALRDEVELIGLSETQRLALLQVKEQEAIVDRELYFLAQQNAGASPAALASIEREIELRRQRIDLLADKDDATFDAQEVEKAAKAQTDAIKQQQKDYEDMWKSVDDFAHDVYASMTGGGKDTAEKITEFFKATLLDLLYRMTVKKWIVNISGSFDGGGGGIGGSGFSLSDLSDAYSAYSGGASSVGGTSSAIGSYLGGGMSGANAAGSIYANTTGTGISGLLSTNSAYGTAGAGAGSGGAGAAMGYLGYAALIAAAVVVAEGLYDKGWNREALGDGNAQTKNIGQFTSFQTDPSIGQASIYEDSTEKLNRSILQMVGVNDKWSDIFSGTTRMAWMFGRKLKGYGMQADIAGGSAQVSGFADYKGGVLRSNKTVAVELDARDAQQFQQKVDGWVEGARQMAVVMGYGGEALDSYTGKIKVNLKGADTAAEVAQRYQDAQQELQREMLSTASGTKITKEAFAEMMDGINSTMEAAGVTGENIAAVLVQGMTGKLTSAQVGEQLSEIIIGGIYNTIAAGYAQQIAQVFTSQILTPVFTAITAGVPITQAVSQAAISNVVATAQNAAANLSAIFSDPGFQSAIAGIQSAIGSIAGIGSSPAKHVRGFGGAMRSAGAAAQKATEIAQERYSLETELLNLLGDTHVLRARELAGVNASNRALKMQIWRLQDSKTAMDDALSAVEAAIDLEREGLDERLDAARESEQQLNDIFNTLRDNIRDLNGEVESTAAAQLAEARALLSVAVRTGNLPTNDALAEAIGTVRGAIEDTQYASQFERDRDTLILSNQLAQLNRITGEKMSTEEQTIALLEEQVQSLDKTLVAAKAQVNALMGVDTSVKSTNAAVGTLNAAMATYAAEVKAARNVPITVSAPPVNVTVNVSGGGGGFGGGGTTAPTPAGWTADGYLSKNPDLRAAFDAENLGVSPQFNKDPKLSALHEYAAWHWANAGQGEGRKFAKGGAFTNGIVRRPTDFLMGQMGEATPEGILPLANIGGSLGVRSTPAIADPETKQVLGEVRDLLKEINVRSKEGNKLGSRQNQILEKLDSLGFKSRPENAL